MIYVSLSCFQPWPEQLLEQYFNLHLMQIIPKHRRLKHAEWETPQMETCQSRTGLKGTYVVRWSLLYLFTWFLKHINAYHAIIRCEIHGEFSSRNSVSWITCSRLHIWRGWKRFVSIDELCVQEMWPMSFCRVPLSYGGAKTIDKLGFWWLDLQYTICNHYLIYVSLSCFQPWPEQLLEQYFNLHLMQIIPKHRRLKHAEWETPQMETCQSGTGLKGAYVVRWSLLYLFTWFWNISIHIMQSSGVKFMGNSAQEIQFLGSRVVGCTFGEVESVSFR